MAGPGAMVNSGLRGEPTQLALALDHAESLAREDFLAGPSNGAALGLIESWPDWPSRTILLRGPEGSGKSYLAAIWARESGARTLSPRALDGGEVPVALATGALVLENLAEGRFDEAALFHLLNLAREERAYVLITARTAPTTWRTGIADLASRLRALPVVALTAPDDALFRAVLVKLFTDRQVAVDESLVSFLTTRIERSFAAARAAVTRLDREALRLRPPTPRALAGGRVVCVGGWWGGGVAAGGPPCFFFFGPPGALIRAVQKGVIQAMNDP